MRPSDSNKIFKAALSRKSLPTPAVHCIWSSNVLCTALTLCLAREASSWLRRLADRLMRSSQSIDSSFILCWMSGVAKCFAATRPLPVLSTRSITGWRPCSSMSSFYNNTPQAVKEFWWKAASLSHLSTPQRASPFWSHAYALICCPLRRSLQPHAAAAFAAYTV